MMMMAIVFLMRLTLPGHAIVFVIIAYRHVDLSPRFCWNWKTTCYLPPPRPARPPFGIPIAHVIVVAIKL